MTLEERARTIGIIESESAEVLRKYYSGNSVDFDLSANVAMGNR